MQSPSSKKEIDYRVMGQIAQLRGSAEEILEYVEDEYGFKVIAALPGIAKNQPEKRKPESDELDSLEPVTKRQRTD